MHLNHSNRLLVPGEASCHPSSTFAWFCVSEPGILKVLGDLGEKINIYMKIEAQEQYSLIDTIFNYIFDFGSPGKYL